MNTPMFGHGQLRLYLLSALTEHGRMSGYDLIQALEKQFDGLYSPSAGTVYPRLAKLEEEGLVSREDEGRKSMYTITDAGREELAQRADEVEGMREHVASSSEQLADDLQRRVAEGAAHITSILGSAAAAARAGAEAEMNRRATEPDRDSSTGSATDSGSRSSESRHDGSPRDPFFGLSFEGLDKLARDIGRADRFRTEHSGDFAAWAQLARNQFLGTSRGASFGKPAPTGAENGTATGAADAADNVDPGSGGPARTSTPGQSEPQDAVLVDEVIDEVIDVEVLDNDEAGDTPDETPDEEQSGLSPDQVLRIAAILRSAADELEATLDAAHDEPEGT